MSGRAGVVTRGALMMLKKASMGMFIAIVIGSMWLIMPPRAASIITAERIPNADSGHILLQAGGCFACHTDTDDYAGGLRLDSPFGDFYSPNITMNTTQGIGGWSLNDFALAVRQGISPEGTFYYPVMPFTAYQGMTDQDIADMWAALQQLPNSDQSNIAHDLPFPFNQRLLLKGWRLLFFKQDRVDPEQRGAYLAEHVLHCAECHTPRNRLGALIASKHFAGNDQLPDDNAAPDIRSHVLKDNGWVAADLKYLFAEGMLPNGDYVGGTMVEVTDYGTAALSSEDRALLADYLLGY